MSKLKRSEQELLSLKKEVEIMRELRHENIIALYDWFETETDVRLPWVTDLYFTNK